MAGPGLAMATAVAAVSLGAGCGGGDSGGGELGESPAPPASEFPSANGRTLTQVARANAQPANLVVSPTAAVYERGENRFGFGVFTVSREQVGDAQVAIYAAPSGGGKAIGPFPARIESLAVKPQFESQTTDLDPDSAKVVYVTSIDFDREGNWDLLALFREGGGYTGTFSPTVKVGGSEDIPVVGERPPRIHTPTVSEVGGDVGKIDTRSPPDDMHKVDFADVFGKEPVVLLFATPALCESRVCGPVVDVAQEVAARGGHRRQLHPHGGLQQQQRQRRLPSAAAGVRPANRAVALRHRPQGHRSQPPPGRLQRQRARERRPPGCRIAGRGAALAAGDAAMGPYGGRPRAGPTWSRYARSRIRGR